MADSMGPIRPSGHSPGHLTAPKVFVADAMVPGGGLAGPGGGYTPDEETATGSVGLPSVLGVE